jgi:hypothetical protein
MAGINAIGEPTTVLFREADLLDQAADTFPFHGAHGHGVIDMVMWSALLLKGDAVYLTESQSAFRIHAAQRQHDPAMAQRNIASIRGSKAAGLVAERASTQPSRREVAASCCSRARSI